MNRNEREMEAETSGIREMLKQTQKLLETIPFIFDSDSSGDEMEVIDNTVGVPRNDRTTIKNYCEEVGYVPFWHHHPLHSIFGSFS